MILVFGSINVDLVARVDRIARPGETVLSPGYALFYGGKGANQAVAAARSVPAGSGVLMCGAIGGDAFGEGCRENFVAEGIDLAWLQVADAPTGSAFISVDAAGENAITVASGANRLLDASGIAEQDLDRIRLAVLQMEVPLEENLALARRLKPRNTTVILNFAPARDDLPKDALLELLRAIDYLVVNEHEAATACHALGLPEDDGQGLSVFLDVPVIVTLGANGVDLHRPGGTPWHCEAAKIEVVDTTGAGDTFVGVLASGLDGGLSIEAAIRRAAHAASLSCTKMGAQGAMPQLDDLSAAQDGSLQGAGAAD